MPCPEPHKTGRSIPAPLHGLASSLPLPLPIYHHPVVALSLVLMAACLAQIAAWLVNSRLPPTAPAVHLNPAIHGYLYTLAQDRIDRLLPADRAESVLFIVSLVAALLSAAAWYAVARVGLGAEWGLWTALLWVVHPAFAFVAQDPGPLDVLILLTPVSLGVILWWRAHRRRRIALLAGTALGLLALVGLQGLLITPLVLIAMLLAPVRRTTRFKGALSLAVGFGLTLVTAAIAVRPPFQLSEVAQHLQQNWPPTLEHPSSAFATAATHELAPRPDGDSPSCVRFLLHEFRASPSLTLHWLAGRMWRSVYATHARTLQRPVFAMQMLVLIPAVWGFIVALRRKPWRWTAVVCCLYGAVFWLLAGLMEPLARNLTPIGGIPLLFALAGAADIYERIFNRRLTSEPD